MHDFFKPMFKGGSPSVKKFRLYVSRFSPEEQQEYYETAYMLALTEWHRCGEAYRIFFICLIHHDWQRSLNFLLDHTFFGQLRYPLRYGKDTFLMVWAIEGDVKFRKSSARNLAFSFNIAFNSELPPNIDKLRLLFSGKKITAEQLLDILAAINITDGNHGHNKEGG